MEYLGDAQRVRRIDQRVGGEGVTDQAKGGQG